MIKRASNTNTVAPYKKAGKLDSVRTEALAEILARELIRHGFERLTGIRLLCRLRPDGKIWLEIPKEPVA